MLLGRFDPARWLTRTGQNDILLSWRVTLYRNLDRFKFSSLMSEKDRKDLLVLFRNFIRVDSRLNRGVFVPFSDISQDEKDFLEEEGFVLSGETAAPDAAGLFLPEDGLSVILNGAEHIAIRCHAESPAAAHAAADAVDDRLLAGFDIAFSDKIGFLTSSSNYLSNGLRISALLHLPGLKRSGRLKQVLQRSIQKGMIVRDFFGDSNLLLNDLVHFENGPEKYFLRNENDSLADFEHEVADVVAEEKASRPGLAPIDLQDEIGRCLGLVANAARLSLNESVYALGVLMLAASMKSVPLDVADLKRLFVMAHPGHLRALHGTRVDDQTEPVVRADLFRKLARNRRMPFRQTPADRSAAEKKG